MKENRLVFDESGILFFLILDLKGKKQKEIISDDEFTSKLRREIASSMAKSIIELPSFPQSGNARQFKNAEGETKLKSKSKIMQPKRILFSLTLLALLPRETFSSEEKNIFRPFPLNYNKPIRKSFKPIPNSQHFRY